MVLMASLKALQGFKSLYGYLGIPEALKTPLKGSKRFLEPLAPNGSGGRDA